MYLMVILKKKNFNIIDYKYTKIIIDYLFLKIVYFCDIEWLLG